MADQFNTEDPFETTFDASGFSKEDLESKGGSSINKDGHYHVLFNEPVKEHKEGQVPVVRIDMEVLAGTNADQLGRMHFHRIYLQKKAKDASGHETGAIEPISDGSKKNIFKFFTNLGLLTAEDVAGNAKIRLPWERLTNFQAIIEIKNEPYADKNDPTGKKMIDSYKIPYGCNVWQVSDERVAKVPKDPDSLAEFTGGGGTVDVSDI